MTRHQTIARPLSAMEQEILKVAEVYAEMYRPIPVHKPKQFDVQHGVCVVEGEFVRILAEKESKR